MPSAIPLRHGGTAELAGIYSIMSINGFLNLGTGLSGTTVLTPPSGAGYAPQAINFDTIFGGIVLNEVSCSFGPVTAPWGTLTVFGVTDVSGNAMVPPGTLQSPYTPAVGQIVTVPQGNIALVVGSQFNAGPAPAAIPALSYIEPSFGFVGNISAVLVAAGTYSRALTIQTLPGSTSNVWLRLDGSIAASETGCLVAASGGIYTFGTNAAPLPTGNITAISDGLGGQTVLISGG
jgi:hypothetical protein